MGHLVGTVSLPCNSLMLGQQDSSSFDLPNSPVRKAGKLYPHFIFKGTEAYMGYGTGPGLIGCWQSSRSGPGL